ncbi:hypothetical protein BGZ63DRAFT_91293 [Mariannaea sp. PMI_226]|nr:hypothetical protein BGZ63DRAFT_91293 [Mariannaea sp. PMI_226]
MVSTSNRVSSSDAGAMQLRTRQERHFDEVEASLPDPTASTFRIQESLHDKAAGFMTRLGNLNSFGRQVSGRDIVWLFDNTAYRSQKTGEWEAEFVAAVFEPDIKCHLADVVSGVAKTLGLADDAEERDTIEARLIPFLWDIQTVRVFKLNHLGRELNIGPTSFNGITSDVLKVRHYKGGRSIKAVAKVPGTVKGLLEMQTYYAGEEGWGVISDIDDTIKITKTGDPLGILRETFIEEPRPVSGMPQLYASIQSLLPRDSPWFYLSASPYNLYPLLQQFRDKHYPRGTMILRDSSWRSVAGLLSALTMGTEEYKIDRMDKIHSWLPKRKMILVGDSTQSDPEAYGEMYRAYPDWVKKIFIRKVTDISSVGLEEKNQLSRFEKAFKDVPHDVWHVFEDPDDCRMIVQRMITQDST